MTKAELIKLLEPFDDDAEILSTEDSDMPILMVYDVGEIIHPETEEKSILLYIDSGEYD